MNNEILESELKLLLSIPYLTIEGKTYADFAFIIKQINKKRVQLKNNGGKWNITGLDH